MISSSDFGRRLHRRQVVPLLGRQPGLQRERRHAENRVERRADLVAHVGEERALGLGRLFGLSLRDLQLLDELREPRRLIFELALTRLELARVARHRLFGRFPLGDVARGGVDDLLFVNGVDVHSSQRSVPSLWKYRFSK